VEAVGATVSLGLLTAAASNVPVGQDRGRRDGPPGRASGDPYRRRGQSLDQPAPPGVAVVVAGSDGRPLLLGLRHESLAWRRGSLPFRAEAGL
jgi:hypothetical protein